MSELFYCASIVFAFCLGLTFGFLMRFERVVKEEASQAIKGKRGPKVEEA